MESSGVPENRFNFDLVSARCYNRSCYPHWTHSTTMSFIATKDVTRFYAIALNTGRFELAFVRMCKAQLTVLLGDMVQTAHCLQDLMETGICAGDRMASMMHSCVPQLLVSHELCGGMSYVCTALSRFKVFDHSSASQTSACLAAHQMLSRMAQELQDTTPSLHTAEVLFQQQYDSRFARKRRTELHNACLASHLKLEGCDNSTEDLDLRAVCNQSSACGEFVLSLLMYLKTTCTALEFHVIKQHGSFPVDNDTVYDMNSLANTAQQLCRSLDEVQCTKERLAGQAAAFKLHTKQLLLQMNIFTEVVGEMGVAAKGDETSDV